MKYFGLTSLIINKETSAFYYYKIIIIKIKVGSARLRESDVHPISPKTPAPQYQHIDRKKRKGKRVEDYSRDRRE